MNRVILLDKPGRTLDISSLDEHGARVDLYKHVKGPLNVKAFKEALIDELHRIGFDPEEDFIATVGRQNHIVLGVVLAALQYPKLKLLMYSSADGEYLPITV